MSKNDVRGQRPRRAKPLRGLATLMRSAVAFTAVASTALGSCLVLSSCGGNGSDTPPALQDGLVWDITAPTWDNANWQ